MGDFDDVVRIYNVPPELVRGQDDWDEVKDPFGVHPPLPSVEWEGRNDD